MVPPTNVRVDRDSVQAGEYELLDDHWDELTNDYPFGEDRVPRLKRHYKGETVTLDEEQAYRMLRGGSVVPAGQRQEAEARAALRRARQALQALPPALRDRFAEDEEVLELLARPAVSVVQEGTNVGHPRYANATLGEADEPLSEHPSGTSTDVELEEGDEADAEVVDEGEGGGQPQAPEGGQPPAVTPEGQQPTDETGGRRGGARRSQ